MFLCTELLNIDNIHVQDKVLKIISSYKEQTIQDLINLCHSNNEYLIAANNSCNARTLHSQCNITL